MKAGLYSKAPIATNVHFDTYLLTDTAKLPTNKHPHTLLPAWMKIYVIMKKVDRQGLQLLLLHLRQAEVADIRLEVGKAGQVTEAVELVIAATAEAVDKRMASQQSDVNKLVWVPDSLVTLLQALGYVTSHYGCIISLQTAVLAIQVVKHWHGQHVH